MPEESQKKQKFILADIPPGSCKVFPIQGKRVAVCRDEGGNSYNFYELTPIKPKKSDKGQK